MKLHCHAWNHWLEGRPCGWARGKLGAIALSLLLAVGCASMPRHRSIADLEQLATTQPQRVSLEGQVRRVSPLLSGVAYQLQDESGTIWVHSRQPMTLAPGDRVQLQGQLWQRDIAVKGSDFGEVYIEAESIEPLLETQP